MNVFTDAQPDTPVAETANAPAGQAPIAEADLRDAIGLLKHAIETARTEGYVVDLPFPIDALDRIAISETANVRQAEG